MATKATKKPTAKKTGTAIMKWDEELAKFAQEGASNERVPVGQKVSIKGGVLSIGGQPIKGNTMNVIVLGSAYVNAYYGGAKFDPDNPSSPVCFALSKEEEGLAPHKESHEPEHDQCAGCPMNEFNSADGGNGKGKACKNGRRLAIIAANNLTEDSIADQEIFYLDLPVTSVKGWSFYVHGLANSVKRPPWAMVTEIQVVNDPKVQFRVLFNGVEPVNDGGLLQALKTRVDGMKDDILFPFPKYTEPAAPARGGSRAGGKAGAKGGFAGKNKAASAAAAKKGGARR